MDEVASRVGAAGATGAAALGVAAGAAALGATGASCERVTAGAAAGLAAGAAGACWRWRMPTARSARSRTAQGCAQTPVATGAGWLASRWSSFVSAPSRERQADQSLLASSGPLLSLQLNNPCQRHLSQRVSEDNVVFWNVDAVMHGRDPSMSAAPSAAAVPASDKARSAEFRRRRAAPSRGRRRLATCAGQGSGAAISRAPDARG